jgi:hypothetical protein
MKGLVVAHSNRRRIAQSGRSTSKHAFRAAKGVHVHVRIWQPVLTDVVPRAVPISPAEAVVCPCRSNLRQRIVSALMDGKVCSGGVVGGANSGVVACNRG